MGWETTRDLERFAERAGTFLRSRPVEHTVPLTVIQALRAHGAGDEAHFGWWTETGGAVTGAFLWTPPHPPLLTAGGRAGRPHGRRGPRARRPERA